MTADELREYNRTKQRESRQRRGVGKRQVAHVCVPPVRVLLPPKQGQANFDCSIKLDLEEMTRQMSASQIHAIMCGMATVLSTQRRLNECAKNSCSTV